MILLRIHFSIFEYQLKIDFLSFRSIEVCSNANEYRYKIEQTTTKFGLKKVCVKKLLIIGINDEL